MHRRSYRETSVLLEVFSAEQGRVALVARGVRQTRSRYRNILQPFWRLQISWFGKGELGTLTAVEPDAPFRPLIGRQLIAGFYLNELLLRLLHRHESHRELFNAYDDAIAQLSTPEDEERVLRVFEKRLLQATGYGLRLDHEVQSGKAIDPEERYYYQVDTGPLEAVPNGAEYIKVHGRTLLAIAAERFDGDDVLREAKQLMRLVLARYVGTKPLFSRELYHAYLKNMAYSELKLKKNAENNT
ncbi:MAG: DNA repair protein RecO [Gammaproteobacteria bacterium]|nr:DNA repair protein RecO [Gammaproteobacteria bacterium]